MSLSENKAIALKFCEQTWGNANLQAIDQLASPNFQVDYPILPQPLDSQSFKAWVADVHTGFPDLQFIIKEVIAEGEKVVISWIAKGNHTGKIKMLNLAPTGKFVSYTGIIIYRLSEGKIIEESGEEDALGLL